MSGLIYLRYSRYIWEFFFTLVAQAWDNTKLYQCYYPYRLRYLVVSHMQDLVGLLLANFHPNLFVIIKIGHIFFKSIEIDSYCRVSRKNVLSNIQRILSYFLCLSRKN